MPRYLVVKTTMVSHQHKIYQPGDIADIEWPVDADGKSLEPKLSGNLKLLKPEKKPAEAAAAA